MRQLGVNRVKAGTAATATVLVERWQSHIWQGVYAATGASKRLLVNEVLALNEHWKQRRRGLPLQAGGCERTESRHGMLTGAEELV